MRTNAVFRIVTGAALLTALGGCGQSAQQAPAPMPAITAQARIAWYDQCWQDFNDSNWGQLATCYSPDATSRQMNSGQVQTFTGPDAIVAAAKDFKTGFPDARGIPVLTLVNGTHLLRIHVLTGTNTGELKGADGKMIKPTGKSLSLPEVHLADMAENALIATHEELVADSGSFAAQLGLSKAPAHPPAAVPDPAYAVTVVAKGDATEQANLTADQESFDAFNQHDAKAYRALLADDYVAHDYADPADADAAGQIAMNKELWGAFSDAHLTDSLWAAGDYVVAVGEFTGTNDGAMPSMKLKATGRKVTVPYVQVDKLQDGKLKEEWLFYDSAAFGGQLMAKPTGK